MGLHSGIFCEQYDTSVCNLGAHAQIDGRNRGKNVDRVLEITEELVKLSFPKLIPFSSLIPVLRPIRQNIVMISNPSSNS